MAKPKKKRAPREIIIGFKGYPEFKTWVLEMAAELRLPVSVLLEHALIEYARNHGIEKDPPER